MSRLKVFYIIISIGALFSKACGTGLTVTPSPQVAVGAEGEVVSLLCTATERPSICLWRTPYQSIYTVGGGRVWEDGRLSSSPGAGPRQCGLVINGLEARDAGAWQCEVGAVVDGEFTTTTAITMVTVVQRGASETGPTLLEGLEGNEAVLPCLSSGGTSATCEWTSPYGTQMSLEPGEYAERGRLLAGDDCSLKVSSLQGRDEGSWICRVGNSQRAISLTIETPLKLSAPTSILQQADERATLVCHANKEYASCEWETPYGRTVSFSDNHREEESGRLQYFGFSSMDCGIVIRDIGTRDSGGWTCRVSATVAGKHQVSADIVRLFVEPSQFAGHEKPRALQPPAPAPAPDYGFGDYDRGVPLKETNEYDAFDYVNGDFDKVAATRPTLPRPGVVSQTQADQSSGVVRPQASSTLPPQVSRTIEEDDGFIRDIQRIGKFGTVRIDKIPNSRPPTSSAVPPFVAFRPETGARGRGETSVPAANFNVFPAVNDGEKTVPLVEEEKEEKAQTGLNPRELDFLARISGSRVDDRPFRLPENETSFGLRQSGGAGSNFQFGDIHLVGEGTHRGREETPRHIDAGDGARQKGRGRGEVAEKIEDEEYHRKRVMEEQQRRLREEALKEEEERREKIKKLREQQIEETRKLQEEREKKRLEEEKKKEREEQEREEAAKQKLLEEERKKKIEEERQRKIALRRAEEKRMRELREEQERKAALAKLREEREKQLMEEREKRLKKQQERERKEKEAARRRELEEQEKARRKEQKRLEEERRQQELEAEREKKLREERERQLKEEKEKKIREERERKMREQREKRRKEERERRLREEREKKRLAEEAKKKREKEERERVRLEEERKKALEDERREKAALEELHRQALENERLENERIEKERKLALEKEEREKAILEEKRREEELAKKVLEEEREKKRLAEIEERRKNEREKIRQDLFEQRKKAEEEDRRQRLQEERQRKIDDEKEKLRQAEVRRIQANNERKEEERKRQQARQEEMERKLKVEREKIRQEELENERKEAIERKKKAEEEERLRRIEKEREEKFREEREKARQAALEARRIEQKELAAIRQREKERREEIEKLRQLQIERDKKLEEEREKIRAELLEEQKREEQELEMIRAREKARREELEKLRELQAERSKLLAEERERLQKENKLQKEKEENEAARLRQQADARRAEIENLRAQQLEREKQLREERERIKEQKEQLEKQQRELVRQRELLEQIRKQQEEAKALPSTTKAPLPTVKPEQLKKCLINPWPEAGNITCTHAITARGQYIVKSGHTCHLTCKKGFVTIDAKETVCQDGTWSESLYCVKPGAMLVVGGRGLSGVLPTVELITSGGVCKNIVPDLPHSRWKMITASVEERHVVACGGVNFLGDPKTDCWRLDFSFNRPRWTDMASLNVPRDAAAWAAESGLLYVMGGNLGPLSGYTASVEVYDPGTQEWKEGPNMPSSRASHCAIGAGDGSIIVTGGYGALGDVQRLDLNSGQWSDLPPLKPVRAQHGCALVELRGESGMMVVGGDSGGTRLNDVRFLALDRPGAQWEKVADLKTARWGRPSVGTIGGKITVIGGWDGRKALNSVEFYNSEKREWEESRRTRLAQERRWAAATQISHKLFSYCVQKRS